MRSPYTPGKRCRVANSAITPLAPKVNAWGATTSPPSVPSMANFAIPFSISFKHVKAVKANGVAVIGAGLFAE